MTKAALRRLAHVLLHTGDAPERTAAAFSIGILIGFSPLLGLHTLLALLVAFAFRLNRLAVLAGAYVNLPWFMGPYYAGVTALGALILGIEIPADMAARLDGVMGLPGWGQQAEGILHLFYPFIWPFVLGSSLGCTVLAAVAYQPALRFVRRRRAAKSVSPDFRRQG